MRVEGVEEQSGQGLGRVMGTGVRQVLMSWGSCGCLAHEYVPACVTNWPSLPGIEGFLRHGTSIAKPRKVLGKLEQVGQLIWV